MIGARYRRIFEQRERRQKERRIKHFVDKRSKMHWGVYGADSGEQQRCTSTTVAVAVRGRQAKVEVTYRYQLDTDAVEYYFPMCEIPNLEKLQVQYKQGDGPLQIMEGQLYEQLRDGETRPWEENAPEAENDAGESETASLLGGWWGGDSGGRKADKDEGDGAEFYYFFGTSPGLKTLDTRRDLVVKVVFEMTCKMEKQQYEDTDVVTFTLPLTIFDAPPTRWEMDVQMHDFIRRIRSKLNSQRIYPEISHKKAVVRFPDAHPVSLEDNYLQILIELGEPIEPRCADPMALFIFATFVGLMVWFSLTKELH